MAARRQALQHTPFPEAPGAPSRRHDLAEGFPPDGSRQPMLDPLASIVAFSPASTQTYLGSPSLVRLPDRTLLVAHDFFGPGSPKDRYGREHLTHVYRSADEGGTWVRVAEIPGAFWSTLFLHAGALYLLGCSAEYGDIVIRRSDDGGCSWTTPADERSGLLFRGGPGRTPPNYHGAPVPVLRHAGRLWRAFEDCDPCEWGSGFRACVISAPEDADLLDARQWRMTNKLRYDKETDPPDFDRDGKCGWLEGNVLADPGGQLWNVLRVHSTTPQGYAAFVRLDPHTHALSFDPAHGFVPFPGGMTKFTIRYDPVSRRYWTLSNNVTNPANPSQRSVLSLHSSEDLRRWRHERTVLDNAGLPDPEPERQVGFQYVDWHFDGEDLIAAVRTAYRGAHNYHDSNYIVFQCVRRFREV